MQQCQVTSASSPCASVLLGVLRPASNVAAPDCAHCHAGIASLLSLAPEAKTVVGA